MRAITLNLSRNLRNTFGIALLTCAILQPAFADESAPAPEPELNIFGFSQTHETPAGKEENRVTVYWIKESDIPATLGFVEKDLAAEGVSPNTLPQYAIADKNLKNTFDSDKFRDLKRFTPTTWVDASTVETPQYHKPKNREISSEKDEILKAQAAAEEAFEKYYLKNYQVRRLSLIVSRIVVNGTVSGIGFYIGGMSPMHSIILGSILGGLSGTFQIYAPKFTKFLSTNEVGIKLAKRLGFKMLNAEIKKSGAVAMLIKWAGMEVGFLAILKFSSYLMGDLPPGLTLLEVSAAILLTASKSMVSQGLWDTSIAKAIGAELLEAIHSGDFVKAAKLRFQSEISAFVGSMLWAGAAVSDLMHIPMGNYVFGALAAMGGGNHIRLLLRDSGFNFANAVQKLPFWCDRHLTRRTLQVLEYR